MSIFIVNSFNFTSYHCKVGLLACIQVTLEESGNPLATVSAFGINDEECQVRLPDCENMWNAKITKHTLCEGILSPATCAKMPRTNITSNLPQVGFCAVCQVEASVRRVTVRGFCELSMFDRFVSMSSISIWSKGVFAVKNSFFLFWPVLCRVYNYIINEDGQPMYLGSRSSVLFYNKTIPSWVWWGPELFFEGHFYASHLKVWQKRSKQRCY